MRKVVVLSSFDGEGSLDAVCPGSPSDVGLMPIHTPIHISCTVVLHLVKDRLSCIPRSQ
jgi:hypothetical protein